MNIDAEQAVLGSLLLSDAAIPKLVVDLRLTEQSFQNPIYGRIWAAMVHLHGNGDRIDTVSLSARLKGRDDQAAERVEELAVAAPSAANVLSYARTVLEAAEWRTVQDAELLLHEAIEHRDRDRRAKAEQKLASAHRNSSDTMGPEELTREVWRHLEGKGPKSWKTPYRELNRALGGGLRAGQVTILGGWSSHGKSAWLDGLLMFLADNGAKVHLYINEQTQGERGLRQMAMRSGVDFGKITEPERLAGVDHDALVRASPLPVGCTRINDWNVEQVAMDIRYRGWDVCAVDLIHEFYYEKERDIANISRTLNAAAKVSGCHLINVVHLNELRSTGDYPPPPTLRDIRDTGMLKNASDLTLFIYRFPERDELDMARRGDESSLMLEKARGGYTTRVGLRFDGPHVRFSEVQQ